jgi:LPS-assembly protein
LELKAGIFENLDTNDTSKYTYFFPDGSFSYNTKNIKNFNTNFNTYFLGQKFSKNQKQAKIKNIITFDSNQYINKKYGIGSTFKASVINNNIYNDNITNAENNLNFDNYTTFAVDNTFPMAKFSKGSYQTLTPRIFLKNTFGTMKDARSTDKILNYSDIFSMNRTNDLDKPETGFSIGHGFDYIYSSSSKLNPENQFKTSFGLGQVLRKNQLENMPRSSSLNNKTSDIAGYSKLDFFGDKKMETNEKINFLSYFNQNKISINYDFNLENNLSKLNRNKINLDGSYNNLYTSITFDEKNNHTGNARSGEIKFKGMIANNYFISLNAKKNFKTNSSEFHNLSLNFENDCLLASLALSKDFYYDKDLKNEKTLIFSIILKPFSDNFAPDLSDFIN